MVSAAAEVRPRDSHAIARLPIDRVFTMKGFGTVVTGTLVAGTIRREDELEVFPAGRRVRVRGVQVHGQAAEAAVAGQRTALNLAGAGTEDLSRGMTLAPPATFEATQRADVLLRLLPSAERELKDRARVHFHSFTMETVAEVLLYGTKKIAAGQQAFARLKLPEPTLLLPGDRFILRQFSPVVTIGGGTVLDATPIPRTPRTNRLPQSVGEWQCGKDSESADRAKAETGISMSQLVAETGWTKSFIEAQLAQAVAEGCVVRIGELLLHLSSMDALKLCIVGAVADFHKQNPLVDGINKEGLRERPGASAEVFDATLGMLVREKKIEVIGELVRLPGRGVVMKEEEAESKKEN